jgi:MFS family permease
MAKSHSSHYRMDRGQCRIRFYRRRPYTRTFDELIPAKFRGRVDLLVNGSFWLGAALGALATPFLVDQRLFSANVGWRLGFGIGAVLGLSILLLGGSFRKARDGS